MVKRKATGNRDGIGEHRLLFLLGFVTAVHLLVDLGLHSRWWPAAVAMAAGVVFGGGWWKWARSTRLHPVDHPMPWLLREFPGCGLVADSRLVALAATSLFTISLSVAVLGWTAVSNGSEWWVGLGWTLPLAIMAWFAGPRLERFVISNFVPVGNDEPPQVAAVVLALSDEAAGETSLAKIVKRYDLPSATINLDDDLRRMQCPRGGTTGAPPARPFKWEQPLRMIRYHALALSDLSKGPLLDGDAVPEFLACALPDLPMGSLLDGEAVPELLACERPDVRRGPLKHVYVVASRGRSDKQVADFAEFVRRYFKDLLIFQVPKGKDEPPRLSDTPSFKCDGVNFEDFPAVYDAIARADNHRLASGLESIAVDITGGQKPTTMAAAIYTVGREMQAQYVETGGAKRVVGYDLHSADKGGT